MKVLIVDDEILVRKGLSVSIDWDSLGFDCVLEAANGLEAFEIAKAENPQLIIMDIRMPKMDGLELIKLLKQHNIYASIIMLSCLNDMKYVREAMRFGGALDYIPKLSMSNEELTEIVRRAVDIIHSRQDFGRTEPSALEKPDMLSFQEEARLRHLLDEGNIEECNVLITSILESHTYDSLKDCIAKEIFYLVSSIYKKYGGNIYNLTIGCQDVFSYLEEGQGSLNARIAFAFEAALNYLNQLKSERYGPDITKAVQYMYANYENSIKLSNMAAFLNMSVPYLSKLFKQKTGENFVDFLNNIRLEKAKELLESSEFTVSQIAEAVGFSTESYFSRLFKQCTGVSPAQYRSRRP